MKPRLRWKKMPEPTGLATVGAGPAGSFLHDGNTEYAHLYPVGGDWRGPPKGWFWCANIAGKYMNTCDKPRPIEVCKAEAMEWVKKILAKAEEDKTP